MAKMASAVSKSSTFLALDIYNNIFRIECDIRYLRPITLQNITQHVFVIGFVIMGLFIQFAKFSNQ